MRETEIVVAHEHVIGAQILGKMAVLVAKGVRRRRQPGQEDVHEIGATAEHAAGRIHPQFDHFAPAHEIRDRARLDERQTDRRAIDRRREGHPRCQRRVMLHVVEIGEALCRPGKARVLRHVGDSLAVNMDAPLVAQRCKKSLAGANAHVFLPPEEPHSLTGSAPADPPLAPHYLRSSVSR